MYDVALFVHLLGVVMLVGAVTTTIVASLRAQTATTVGEVRSLTAVTKKIDVVIGPAMLLILAPGLYMVSRHGDDGSIRWSSGWVDVAIVVFLVMSVLGPTIESGHAKKVLKSAEGYADGPVPAELDALRCEPVPTYVALFGASQIIAFLYLMSNKPSLVGSVAACAVLAAVSVVVASRRLRQLSRPAAVDPGAVDPGRARPSPR